VFAVRTMLAALKRSTPMIGGPDQIVSIGKDVARWVSPPPSEHRAAEALAVATIRRVRYDDLADARLRMGVAHREHAPFAQNARAPARALPRAHTYRGGTGGRVFAFPSASVG
jgi:hypothetical protein